MKKMMSVLLLLASIMAAPAALAELININKATAAVLQENLKGIGEKKAQAIVAYRKEFGAFKTLDEIMEVKGIGKGIFKKIKADISLDKGATALGSGKATVAPKKAVSKKPVAKKPAKTQDAKASNKVKKPAAKDQKANKDGKASKVKKS